MKNKSLRLITVFLLLTALIFQSCTKETPDSTNNNGGNTTGNNSKPPTVTEPNTTFVASQDYTVSARGYWTESFTIDKATSFVFRFASEYQAQASIITPDQLTNFKNFAGFNGFASFNNQFGTNYVTLNAGTYYVAIRNSSTASNKWSVELDNVITLPSTDRATFYDNYATGTKSFSTASKFWQPFTIQTGYRYFLDGCSVNCDVKIISSAQLAAYQGGQTYQYYSDYVLATGATPGLWEIKLPAGDYYLISTNTTVAALTYVLERWKVN